MPSSCVACIPRYADECAARRAEEIKEEEKNAETDKKKAEALKEEALSGKMDINVPKAASDKSLPSRLRKSRRRRKKTSLRSPVAWLLSPTPRTRTPWTWRAPRRRSR